MSAENVKNGRSNKSMRVKNVQGDKSAMSEYPNYCGEDYYEARDLVVEVEAYDVPDMTCSPEFRLQIARVHATLAVAEAIQQVRRDIASRN